MPYVDSKHPHNVAISPLLRKLVGNHQAEETEIVAALALIQEGEFSDAQNSLLLGLLKARRHALNDHEVRLLDAFLDQVEPPSPAGSSISVAPLMRRLLDGFEPSEDEIAEAVAWILEDRLSNVQSSMLLGLLAFTGFDKEPKVLVKTAEKMLAVANRPDRKALSESVDKTSRPMGQYRGGLCDIVGTGGDGHSTFNVSTTASIIASSHLTLSKHGNRASSSTSGSADLLEAVRPRGPLIEAVTAGNLPDIYRQSSYAFLFAPKFHPGMRRAASLRKDIGIRTIFNVLGPLVNPAEDCIEARIVGVAEPRMGPVFAEALRMKGAKKAMVVCGAEHLDEISCAGKTYCWRLTDANGVTEIDDFELEPADFGLPTHLLSEVAGGKLPHENATTLMDLLGNKLSRENPVLHFVLMNAGALFAIAGVCEDGYDERKNGIVDEVIKQRGPGGQRWREGTRLAREAIEKGFALRSFHKYIETTHSCGG